MLTQSGKSHGDLRRREGQHIRESDRLVHRGFDPVQDNGVARFVCVVDDVIDSSREAVGVVGVDCREIRPGGERVDDVVGDPVTLVLTLSQCPGELMTVGVANEVVEDPCGCIGVLASFSEESAQGLFGRARTSDARRVLRGPA